MPTTIGVLSLVGLVLATVVHIVSILGLDVQHVLGGAVFMFPAAAFAAVVAYIVVLNRHFGAKPSFFDIASLIPGWKIRFAVVLLAYSLLGFAYAIEPLEGGAPRQVPGGYELSRIDRSGVVLFARPIGESTYHKYRALELRAFSGTWMFLLALPALSFLSPRLTTNASQRNAYDD